MAYQVPTAADLIARYPAFAAVAPDTIEIHIADAAANGVDETWSEASYAPAIAALAAHNMTLLGLGAQEETDVYARAGVTGLRDGAFSVSFSDRKVGTASGGSFQATPYGRAYWVLLRKNKGGPRLVASAGGDPGWGPLGQLNNGGIVPWAF